MENLYVCNKCGKIINEDRVAKFNFADLDINFKDSPGKLIPLNGFIYFCNKQWKDECKRKEGVYTF
jgi:hypothetical protein